VIFAIKESNFGIYVDWMHKRNLDDNTMVFERVFFLPFEACVEGFKYYRSLISIDGIYLYRWYDEKLLIVVTFW